MSETPVHRWIAAVAPGRRFVDIGGVGEWAANERVSQAIAAGAARAAVADILPAGSDHWRAFRDRMEGLGIPPGAYDSYPEVDITDPGLAARLPGFDVVHCTGILYHCPDPVASLRNLRRAAGRWLIVNTIVCPARVENEAGALAVPDGAALFLPGLSETERAVLRLRYLRKYGWDLDVNAPRPRAPGAAMPHVMPDGRLSCLPCWWLFTVPAFRALLRLLELDIRDEWTWDDHAHFALCERAGG